MKMEMLTLICFLGLQVFAADGCTHSGWSVYINDNKPTTGLDGGEHEDMNMTERYRFCPFANGKLTAIDCTSENGVNYDHVGLGSTGLSCRVDRGLTCHNKLVSTNRCVDFRIRLFCNCTNPMTTSTAPGTSHIRHTGTRRMGSSPASNTGTTHNVIGHMTSSPTNGGHAHTGPHRHTTSSPTNGGPAHTGPHHLGITGRGGAQSGTTNTTYNGHGNTAPTASSSWIAAFLLSLTACVTSLYISGDVTLYQW